MNVQVELFPATEALQRAMSQIPSMESRRTWQLATGSCSFGAFRNVCSAKALGMEELLRAARPVEDSIAFPKIEWVNDEGDDESDDDSCLTRTSTALNASNSTDSWGSASSLREGHLGEVSVDHGLVRSKSRHTLLTSLASFGSVSTTHNSEASVSSSCGSWGHFLTEDDGASVFPMSDTILSFETPRFQRDSYRQQVSPSRVEE